MGKRRSKFIEPKSGLYILGEGITEKYYFEHLKSIFQFRCIVRPRFFYNNCIEKFEKEIKNLLQGDITIICVLDADVSKRNAKENEKLTKLRKRYHKNQNVTFCDSMPSIEYWFLLHYKDTCPNYTRSIEAERDLKHYIHRYEKTKDFLENELWVREMSLTVGSYDQAIQRANKYTSTDASYSNLSLAILELKKTLL